MLPVVCGGHWIQFWRRSIRKKNKKRIVAFSCVLHGLVCWKREIGGRTVVIGDSHPIQFLEKGKSEK